MTEVKFYRKRHVIKNTNGDLVFEGSFKVKDGTWASINAAKRESRKLQAIHGQGSLRVIS